MTRFSSLDAAVTCGKFHKDAMEMVPGKTVAPEKQRPLSYNVGNVQTRFVDLLNRRSFIGGKSSVAQLPCCPYP
jgi:hypothetical protein